MKWRETTISFEAKESLGEIAQELVCNLFYDMNLTGVTLSNTVDDGCGLVCGTVTGYFACDNSVEQKYQRLENMVQNLAGDIVRNGRISYLEIDEKEWANAWKDHFYPRRIGEKLVVKPTWRDYRAAADDVIIELDPGMAFGTGTHATTEMCARMIEKRLQPGDSFLDIGTGSGILMVAAEKMGASQVWGTDNDPVAVQVARENLLLNQISPDNFYLVATDLASGLNQRFDYITANILTEVIVTLVPDVKKILSPGGYFVCSGIIERKQPLVEEQLLLAGFKIVEIIQMQEWICLCAIN